MTATPPELRSLPVDERLAESQRRREAAYEYVLARRGMVTIAEVTSRFGIHYDRARATVNRARAAMAPDLAEKKQPPTPKRRFLAVIGDRMVHPSAIRTGDRVDRFTVEVL